MKCSLWNVILTGIFQFWGVSQLPWSDRSMDPRHTEQSQWFWVASRIFKRPAELPSQRFPSLLQTSWIYFLSRLWRSAVCAEGGDSDGPTEMSTSGSNPPVTSWQAIEWIKRVNGQQHWPNPPEPFRILWGTTSRSVSLSAALSLPTAEQKVIEKTRLRDRRLGRKTHGGQKICFSTQAYEQNGPIVLSAEVCLSQKRSKISWTHPYRQ